MKRTLVKERRLWRSLGASNKEQRQLARSLLLASIYVVGFLVWFAYTRWSAFRELVAFLFAVLLLLYVFSRAMLAYEQAQEKKELSDLQDVDMSPYNEHGFLHRSSYSSVPVPDRKVVTHTDGHDIEVIPDEEIAEKKAKVEKLRKKGKEGNIDFEIE